MGKKNRAFCQLRYQINERLGELLAIVPRMLLEEALHMVRKPLRMLYHGGVPAFLNGVQFRIWDEFMKLLRHVHGSNKVVLTPKQERRNFDQGKKILKVVLLSTTGGMNEIKDLTSVS